MTWLEQEFEKRGRLIKALEVKIDLMEQIAENDKKHIDQLQHIIATQEEIIKIQKKSIEHTAVYTGMSWPNSEKTNS